MQNHDATDGVTFKHVVVTVELLLAQSADQGEHIRQQQAALERQMVTAPPQVH